MVMTFNETSAGIGRCSVPREGMDTVLPGFKLSGVCMLFLSVGQTALSQSAGFHGQASAWIGANNENSESAQGGFRYIPDLLLEHSLADQLNANVEISLNVFATARFVDNNSLAYEDKIKPYRGWIRISTEKFEVRVGLQKLNFGSAMLFRPLMWFDRIDPRDPLQLTDGVYAALARYYFQNNANIWLWGLYGNDDTKGWELSPTEKKSIEYGGRAQSSLWTGEVGVTYHHRRADLGSLIPAPSGASGLIAPEDRIGLDGKWDIGIGVWFEGVVIRQESELLLMKYQRQWTLGADYTFAAGNGLYAATEYFRTDNSKDSFGSGEGAGFSGLSLSYPINVVDQVSAMLYRDWKNQEWYRLMTWQRTYDNWRFYLLGFWNPQNIQIYRSQAGANAFAGTGVQVMVVFNH
jgi:hypothetical protein